MRSIPQESTKEIEIIRRFYALLNGNEINEVLKLFDPQIERIEPEGFPTSGTYHGVREMEKILVDGRSTWAEGGCFPTEFMVSEKRILALVHVKVRLHDRIAWIDGKVADGFILKNGKIKFMQTFVDQQKGMDWLQKENAS